MTIESVHTVCVTPQIIWIVQFIRTRTLACSHMYTHVHTSVSNTLNSSSLVNKKKRSAATCDRADTKCSQSGMRAMCCVKTDNSNQILLIHSNHSTCTAHTAHTFHWRITAYARFVIGLTWMWMLYWIWDKFEENTHTFSFELFFFETTFTYTMRKQLQCSTVEAKRKLATIARNNTCWPGARAHTHNLKNFDQRKRKGKWTMKFRLSSFTKQSLNRSFEKPHDDHIGCVCVCLLYYLFMHTCVFYNSLSLFHSAVHSTFLPLLLSLSLSLSFSLSHSFRQYYIIVVCACDACLYEKRHIPIAFLSINRDTFLNNYYN